MIRTHAIHTGGQCPPYHLDYFMTDFNHQFNAAHLDWLESESIHILRELAAECERPAL